jgi:hypothetical protein
MPRLPRLDAAGEVHQLIIRRIEGRNIFEKAGDDPVRTGVFGYLGPTPNRNKHWNFGEKK